MLYSALALSSGHDPLCCVAGNASNSPRNCGTKMYLTWGEHMLHTGLMTGASIAQPLLGNYCGCIQAHSKCFACMWNNPMSSAITAMYMFLLETACRTSTDYCSVVSGDQKGVLHDAHAL